MSTDSGLTVNPTTCAAPVAGVADTIAVGKGPAQPQTLERHGHLPPRPVRLRALQPLKLSTEALDALHTVQGKVPSAAVQSVSLGLTPRAHDELARLLEPMLRMCE